MKKVLHSLILLLIANYSVSQINVQWETRYTGTGSNPDNIADMVVDGAGNVYVTGSSYTGAANGYDIVTRKYDNSGAVLWTMSFNGSGSGTDVANAIAIDASGNVFVTGYSFRGGSDFDITTIKYSPTGTQMWQNYSGNGTSAFDEGKDIIVDGNGDVIVTGGVQNTAGTNTDYRTIKYTNAGAVSWTVDYSNSTNLDMGLAVAVDPANSVYVTGHSFVTGQDLNIRTIKYNSAGTQQYNTATQFSTINSIDSPNSIAVNSAGEVFVAGRVFNGSFFDDDIVVMKYSAAGAVTNSLIINGTANSTDKANKVYIDATNNVYLAGRVKNTGTSEDFYVAKFNSTLALQWSDSYNGPSNNYDEASDIVIDATGNVYVCGSSFTAGSNNDFLTVKYNGSTGTRVWATKFNGTANNTDKAKRIAVDATGNVYVSGDSKGSGTGDDYSTIKYCQLTTDAGLDDQICANQSVQLNVTGGSTISWQPDPSLSCTTCPNPIATPSVTTTYIVSTTDGNNCTDYDTVVIVVNPLPGPVITPSGPTTFCSGDSIMLYASGFSSYTWNTGSTTDSTVANNSGTYIVTVTDAMGCQNSTSILITVNNLPNVDAGTATPYCNGGSAQLNATGATSYVWTPSGTLDNSSIANPIANPTSTTWYYVTGTDGNGCQNEDSVLVTVYPIPNPPIITYLAATHLMTSGYSTGNQWYQDGMPINPGGNGQTYIADTNGYYYVVYTDGNGCSSLPSDTIVISDIIDTSSVNNLAMQYGITVYPNPNNGQFTIAIENSYDKIDVSLFDITSKLIYTQNISGLNRLTVDINHVENGVYFLQIRMNNQMVNYRVIKN